jgi:very-short-patch-repair endonuclease
MVRQPKLEFARKLRKDMSLPEMLIWGRIKVRQEGLPVFRRQYPYGPYVLDFYCAAAKLCIEIDGYAHGTENRSERDDVRDAYLSAQGIETTRIPATDVLADPNDIADGIYRLATERMNERRHNPTRRLP